MNETVDVLDVSDGSWGSATDREQAREVSVRVSVLIGTERVEGVVTVRPRRGVMAGGELRATSVRWADPRGRHTDQQWDAARAAAVSRAIPQAAALASRLGWRLFVDRWTAEQALTCLLDAGRFASQSEPLTAAAREYEEIHGGLPGWRVEARFTDERQEKIRLTIRRV